MAVEFRVNEEDYSFLMHIPTSINPDFTTSFFMYFKRNAFEYSPKKCCLH